MSDHNDAIYQLRDAINENAVTLRDRFAMAALQMLATLVAAGVEQTEEQDLVSAAYRVADRMLAAREVKT